MTAIIPALNQILHEKGRRRPAVPAFFEELDHEETRAALLQRGLLP